MILSLKRAAEKGKFSTKDIISAACLLTHLRITRCCLDRNGAVIRDTIMWQDQRAYQEAAFLKERYLDLIKSTTFSSPSATWSASPQLMWVRDNEPEVYSKIERIMFIDDYVRYQLTGAISTTHIQAQGSLMFDNRKMVWSEDLVKLTGLPMTALPEIRKTTDISGYVTAKAAALTGLKEGIPVVMGASDTSLESYSVGGLKPGDCVLKMATAGGINVFRNIGAPFLDTFIYSHVVDGVWYYGRGTATAAQALRWYRDTFCQKELAEEIAGGENTYQLLDKGAEGVPPGGGRTLFPPVHVRRTGSILGSEAPRFASPVFPPMHRRGHFNRALLEGVTFSLRQCFEGVEEFGRIDQISFVGGGSKSPLWRSILADVFDRKIVKYERDDSSLGAAMLTGVALGVFGSHQEAVAKTAVIDSITEPNPENVETVQQTFPALC